MAEVRSQTESAPKNTKRCGECGEPFTPSWYGQRYCGYNPECERAETEYERELDEARQQRAMEDNYERY